MKASELSLDNLNFNLYLLEGNDLYWLDYAIDFFVSLTEKEYRDFNLKIFDKVKDEDIYEALTTVSMFGGTNVVIVKEKDGKNNYEKDILKAMDNNNYLIYVNCDVGKEIKKKAEIIDCSAQDISVIRKLVGAKLNIDNEAVNMLITYLNKDMSKINLEINKLNAYSQGEKITVDDIKNLVVNQMENQIFDLTNAAAGRNYGKTMEILENFYKRGLPFPMLLSVLINQYRRMLHCSISDLTNAELSNLLNCKEYAVVKSKEVAKKYTVTKLKNLLMKLEYAEYSFKSGIMSDETAFKNVIAELII